MSSLGLPMDLFHSGYVKQGGSKGKAALGNIFDPGGTISSLFGKEPKQAEATPAITAVAEPVIPVMTTTPAEDEIKRQSELKKLEEETKEAEKKKITAGRTKRSTILTSPQGSLVPADVGRKTLLGQ